MLASLNLLNTINNVSFRCSFKVPYYTKSLCQYFTITVICVSIFWVKSTRKAFAFYTSAASHSMWVETCSCGSLPFLMSPKALTTRWRLLRPPALCHGHLMLASFFFFFLQMWGCCTAAEDDVQKKIGRKYNRGNKATHNCTYIMCNLLCKNQVFQMNNVQNILTSAIISGLFII